MARFHIACCNGYYTVGVAETETEALTIAQSHVDGTYDNIISRDGRIVGDTSGFYGPEIPDGNAGYRAQYAYACGYHD